MTLGIPIHVWMVASMKMLMVTYRPTHVLKADVMTLETPVLWKIDSKTSSTT
jgi:hypothetical protein